MTIYDYRPETATGAQIFKQNTGQDPARYLVPDSELYHRRPSLQSGDKVFIWPVGTEGLRESGNATLAIHHYIGDDDADVQIIHKDESRIEMTGTFPGILGVQNKAALRLVIRDQTNDPGKILFLPGIFERIQYVVVENYDFYHDPSDRTHSWDYTVTFIRTGAGKRISDPHGHPAPPNPGSKKDPRGRGARFYKAKVNLQTFRQISKKVYGDEKKWTQLADANMDLQQGIPYHQIPNHRWPYGTKIYY